jgi:hypothetical protein
MMISMYRTTSAPLLLQTEMGIALAGWARLSSLPFSLPHAIWFWNVLLLGGECGTTKLETLIGHLFLLATRCLFGVSRCAVIGHGLK